MYYCIWRRRRSRIGLSNVTIVWKVPSVHLFVLLSYLKLVIFSHILEIIPSQDKAITCSTIKYFAYDISIVLMFNSAKIIRRLSSVLPKGAHVCQDLHSSTQPKLCNYIFKHLQTVCQNFLIVAIL